MRAITCSERPCVVARATPGRVRVHGTPSIPGREASNRLAVRPRYDAARDTTERVARRLCIVVGCSRRSRCSRSRGGSWFAIAADPRQGLSRSGGKVRVGERVPAELSRRVSRRGRRLDGEGRHGRDRRASSVRRDRGLARPASRARRRGNVVRRYAVRAGVFVTAGAPVRPIGDRRVLLEEARPRTDTRSKRELQARRRPVCAACIGSADPRIAVSLPLVDDVGTKPTDVCVDAAGLVLEEVASDGAATVSPATCSRQRCVGRPGVDRRARSR